MSKHPFNLKFKDLNIDGYERVVEIADEKSGLHAIIALHNTTLGPALGGTRAYPYATFDQALNDVLRLARGMTYKSAVVETGTGGGKSIIFADSKKPKSPELLSAFAEAVNYFNGTYICAEDIGMGLADLGLIAKTTRYAVGLPHPKSSGDPSRFTSYGALRGIQAVCKKLWGTESPEGRTIAIQGVGAAGMKLAQYLFWHGAKLIVADVDKASVDQAVREFGAQAVSTDEILSVKCDIVAPCALGAILNATSIPHLKCEAVAGIANNQLHTPEDGEALLKRGILYAPDFVINAGGLLNVCIELEEGGYNPALARAHVNRIYDLLMNVFNEAEQKKLPTHKIAEQIAERNIAQGIGKRTKAPVFIS